MNPSDSPTARHMSEAEALAGRGYTRYGLAEDGYPFNRTLDPSEVLLIRDGLPPKKWSVLRVRVFGYFALEGARHGEETLHTRTE